jgi:hypothetical protein
MTWLIASEEGFLPPGDRVSCLLTAAAVSACQWQHGPYRQFLLQHAIRLDCRASLCGDRVACQYIRETSMNSIETVGSQGSGSEISATRVSLREPFEAVRRCEIQRVRRRLGNLNPDLLVDLAFKQSAAP